MPKTKPRKMKGPEAKAILAHFFVVALREARDTQDLTYLLDEEELEELVAALRVVANNQLANKVKKQTL